MRKIIFTVPESYSGVCVRGFLRGYCGISVRQMAKLKLQQNGICRNGFHVIATDILRSGDQVSITFPDDTKFPDPFPLDLSIIYEDEDLLVTNKPAGMPMYPSPGHNHDSLANAVAYEQQQRKSFFAFRPIYRLDKDTTGLVVLAKNEFAACRLSGKIQKMYLAVCEGFLYGSGTIDRPIGLKPGHTIQRAVSEDGIKAVTRWRSIVSGNNYSLIALKLLTGRTHQIRVHLSDIGHPLAGDDMYGGSLSDLSRQALHCAKVHFIHPVTNLSIHLKCSIPEDVNQLVKKISK